jgi:hypothetical protein
MTRISAPRSRKSTAKEDPFRYGWRFVKESTPEGDVVDKQVPLTEKDVLHFGFKLREYFLVGIPVYVIINIPEESQAGSIQLYGFQSGKTQYEPMLKDHRSQLWLDAARLWLGVAEGKVYLEDEQGNRLPEYDELAMQLDNAKEARRSAEAKAAAEAKARQAAEEKLRELESKLARRTNGKRPNGAK